MSGGAVAAPIGDPPPELLSLDPDDEIARRYGARPHSRKRIEKERCQDDRRSDRAEPEHHPHALAMVDTVLGRAYCAPVEQGYRQKITKAPMTRTSAMTLIAEASAPKGRSADWCALQPLKRGAAPISQFRAGFTGRSPFVHLRVMLQPVGAKGVQLFLMRNNLARLSVLPSALFRRRKPRSPPHRIRDSISEILMKLNATELSATP